MTESRFRTVKCKITGLYKIQYLMIPPYKILKCFSYWMDIYSKDAPNEFEYVQLVDALKAARDFVSNGYKNPTLEEYKLLEEKDLIN